VRLIALFLASLLVPFAGCVGSSGEPTGAEPSATQIVINDDVGGIEGTVVDDQLQPLVGAVVGIKETNAQTKADEAGRFAFGGLAPGAYTVLAQQLGYEGGAKPVDVKVGELASVRFVLVGLTTPEAYTELKIFGGLIECGFGTAAVVGNCIPLQFLFDQIGTNPTSTRTVGKYDVTDPTKVEGGVFEMKWTPSAAGAGKDLGLYVDEDGAGPTSGTNFASKNGPSPVRIQVEKEPYEKIKPSKKLQTRTFLPGTTPPSYVVNQRFEVFATHCYMAPCPDDYTVIQDG
jgi:hypothetical protein